MGVPAGLFLSTVVFGVVSTSLGEEQFLAWGWRVPFLLSIALIAVGLFIRLKILESPAFIRLQQSGRREERPLVAAVRDYRRNLLLAMGMRVAENGLFYVYTVFVLSYGPAALGVSRATMLWGVTLAALVGLVAIPFFGGLSDRVGRRPVYLFGAVFSLAYALPFFWLLHTRSPGDHLAGDCAGRGPGTQRDVRAAGRVLLGVVRRTRAVQRRLAQLSAGVGRGGRPRAVYRHRPAREMGHAGGRGLHDAAGVHHRRGDLGRAGNTPRRVGGIATISEQQFHRYLDLAKRGFGHDRPSSGSGSVAGGKRRRDPATRQVNSRQVGHGEISRHVKNEPGVRGTYAPFLIGRATQKLSSHAPSQTSRMNGVASMRGTRVASPESLSSQGEPCDVRASALTFVWLLSAACLSLTSLSLRSPAQASPTVPSRWVGARFDDGRIGVSVANTGSTPRAIVTEAAPNRSA